MNRRQWTAAKREQADQDRRAALEDLHQQLQHAVEQIETGSDWTAWLAFARGLHRYSFRNLILIRQQRPDATVVASYRTWQAAGRQVRRGEQALRVLAPIIRSPGAATDPDPATVDAPNGDPPDRDRPHRDRTVRNQPTPDSSTAARPRVVGYRAVPVFDIGQTDGDPVTPPAPELLAGEAPAGLWEALVGDAVERGYRVGRDAPETLAGANGITDFRRREITIRVDVDDAQAVKTLAHELGHVLLHDPHADPSPDTDGGARVDCRGVIEVEAESVAYLLTSHHGIDSAGYSFPYIAHWAYAPAAAEQVPLAEVVIRTGDRVMTAATQLIDATDHLRTQSEPAVDAAAARVTRGRESCDRIRTDAAALAAGTVTVSDQDRRIITGILADTQTFFRRHVGDSWVPVHLAERGLYETIGDRGIGHAPAGWTSLVDHLRGLGYTDTHLEAAGVASRTRTGSLIDRFRDRLTIPLDDADGTLVGFTGRANPAAVDDPRVPKYLNSPTTALFNKSEVLYGAGVHRAALASGSVPVVCEGPLDALAVDVAAGRTSTPFVGLAACGTALTAHHASLLHSMVGARRIHLAFDGDKAGERATANAWRQLSDGGCRYVYAAELAGVDPADLVANGQAEDLITALTTARTAAAVATDQWLAGIPDADTNMFRQIGAMRLLLDENLHRIADDERTDYLTHLATVLKLDPATVAADVERRVQAESLVEVTDQCRLRTRAIDRTPTPVDDRDEQPAVLSSEAINREAV